MIKKFRVRQKIRVSWQTGNLHFIMPPFKEGGAYCVAHVGRYVGRSVCRYPLTLCN